METKGALSMLARDLSAVDPEIFEAIGSEARRQNDNLELIASENYTSRAVLEAVGSVLTNKYAEGYPGRRYYGGCVNVDRAESLAISRAKALFSPKDPEAIHANVQPHSGSQANTAVYLACLKPGDTLMGMSLAHGGHLTHGHPLSISGKLYRVVSYGVRRDTEMIDWEEFARVVKGGGPCNEQRVAHRVKAHQQGAWVREAAAAYAAKRASAASAEAVA